jgi:hypothetical protein
MEVSGQLHTLEGATRSPVTCAPRWWRYRAGSHLITWTQFCYVARLMLLVPSSGRLTMLYQLQRSFKVEWNESNYDMWRNFNPMSGRDSNQGYPLGWVDVFRAVCIVEGPRLLLLTLSESQKRKAKWRRDFIGFWKIVIWNEWVASCASQKSNQFDSSAPHRAAPHRPIKQP